jgi:uracil-DNA glycosylase
VPDAAPEERTAGRRPWTAVAGEASGCTRCGLAESRNHVVFGDGDPGADLVLIGTAPGRHEDLTGEPFVGATGNLIENLLIDNDLGRDDVYVTTVVKCRPPRSRPPEIEEITACAPWLFEQLGLISPRVVVTLGDVPTRLILGRDAPLHRIAGYRLPVNGATLIPTHDPADALRGSPVAMSALTRDIRVAKGVLDGRIAGADGALDELRAGQGAATT